MDLKDQVAVVTGGARGIGRAIARRFAAAGATVIIADADHNTAAATAAELGAHSEPTDVADPLAIRSLFAAIDARFGRVHVLVNNAGISATGPLQQLEVEVWD